MSLVLRNIRHRFGDVEAVCGASLEVEAGEIACLFGPSGCGKTTLLRVAAGLEPLQAGAVELDGEVLADETGKAAPPERRPTGFVFQDYVLFPHLTALQNVEFGLAGMGGDKRRQALSELERVGLSGLGKRFPHELSGGQQQRVALARAFVRRPRAMFLDEPFASIDAVLRRQLREDVRRMLKETGAATILVTHDAEEALAMGDRIAIMEAGAVIEASSPQRLFEAPMTSAAALIFAGAQSLDGDAGAGGVNTAFGKFGSLRAAEGPVRLVVRSGGAWLTPDPAGKAVVLESRFAGPDWLVHLRAADGDDTLAIVSKVPFEAGARARLDLDPASVRIFPRHT